MRIVIFLFIVCELVAAKAFSQYRLKGFLGVEGGESFHYVMEFTDSSGYINGYAYTYQTKKKDVKARIEGRLDKENKTLRFRETELLYNHGFESYATICLIQAELKFVKEEEGNVFKGGITTSDITQILCSGGSIVINDAEGIRTLFEPLATENNEGKSVDATPMPPKQVKYVYDTAVVPVKKDFPALEKMRKLTEGAEAVLYWNTDSVTLQIWDGGKPDGDRVSVQIGENVHLNRYLLVKEKKELQLPFTEKEITIVVKAENEGNEPPNTAHLILKDGNMQYDFFVYNSIGRAAGIKIIKK